MSLASSCFDGYINFLYKFRYILLILWLLILCVCGLYGSRLLSSTKDTFEAPSGTAAYDAEQAFLQYFPRQSVQLSYVLFLNSRNNESLADANAPPHLMIANPKSGSGPSVNVNVTLYQYLDWISQTFQNTLTAQYPQLQAHLYSYYSCEKGDLKLVASKFVSQPWANAAFMMVQYLHPEKGVPNDDLTEDEFIDHTRNDILPTFRYYPLQLAPDPSQPTQLVAYQVDMDPLIFYGLTGQEVLFRDVAIDTESDMIRMDSVVLPLAFVVLMYYVKSVRVMIVPLLALALSLSIAFSIMLPLALFVWNVPAVAPSIQMSLCIAMSIDYSLFLLCRFREEVLSGQPPLVAIRHMLQHAGHVVLISGSTLAISFFGLAIFSMEFLRTQGVAGGVAVSCTLLINLSFTPTALMIFPNFFANFSVPNWVKNCKCIPKCMYEDNEVHMQLQDADNHKAEESKVDSTTPRSVLPPQGYDPNVQNSHINYFTSQYMTSSNTPQNELRSPLMSNGVLEPPARTESFYSVEEHARQRQLNSWWYKSAKISTTTKWSIAILVVVLGAFLPICFQTLDMKYTIDNTQIFPRDSEALSIFEDMNTYFSPGVISMYEVFLTTNQTNGVMTQEWFTVSGQLRQEMADQGLVAAVTDVNCISVVPLALARLALNSTYCSQNPAFAQLCAAYGFLFNQTTNEARSASILQVVVNFDPLGDQAGDWIGRTRDLLAKYSQTYSSTSSIGLQFYLTGAATPIVDSVNQVYDAFPYMLAITIALVFVIVGVVFRSILVPVRLVLTLAFSISFAFGMAVFVFQKGYFNWASSNLESVHAVYWLNPVMSFSVLVGLGLDYDVFLFSRIVEYRKYGYTDRASVMKGVYKSGSIITAAGIIMAISFGGLMSSQEMVLVTFGLMLSFAVLFDTFIIRTFVVPALIHLFGSWNWWPGKMPPAHRDEMDQSDLKLDAGIIRSEEMEEKDIQENEQFRQQYNSEF